MWRYVAICGDMWRYVAMSCAVCPLRVYLPYARGLCRCILFWATRSDLLTIRRSSGVEMLSMLYLTPPSFASPPLHRSTSIVLSATDTAVIRNAWERGDSACSLRPLVEAASASSAGAVATLCSSTVGWEGLWTARIEHFEKVSSTGLRVRPHYDLTAKGSIVSHVHAAWGPFGVWLSAAGAMKPTAESKVTLVFDDFWVGSDAPAPRSSPPQESSSLVDKCIRVLGRAAFFESLSDFPVDYVEEGIVAFRFPPLNSCIVARRGADGDLPQRVDA